MSPPSFLITPIVPNHPHHSIKGIDASALDTFKQIAEHCKRCKVDLYSSGTEPHLDLLQTAGVFLPEHRFPDLDAVLSCCEDELLLRHNIGQDHEENQWYDDDDDEEEVEHAVSPRTTINGNHNRMDMMNASTMNNGDTTMTATVASTGPPHSASMPSASSSSATSINALLYDPRKGFTRCLDLIYERHNYGLTNETMEVLIHHASAERLCNTFPNHPHTHSLPHPPFLPLNTFPITSHHITSLICRYYVNWVIMYNP